MRTLAFWASGHKRTARLTIIVSYFFLNVIGLFLGDIIHSLNIKFTPLFFLGAILMTLLGWMLYPSKSRKQQYRNFFWRQKSADLILISATFLFVVYLGNSLNNSSNSFRNPLQAASIIITNNPANVSEPSVAKPNFSKKSLRKKIKTEFKRLRRAYKESTKLQKAIYIFLTILAAGALSYLVMGIACSLYCSGSEALAIITFTLGMGGIIFGTIKLIQRIIRGKPEV